MTIQQHVADAIIKLKADRSGLNRDMEMTEKDMAKRAKAIRADFMKIMAVGAFVGGAVAATVELTRQTAALGDQYQKASQKIGVSVENLSALNHAAKIGGTDIGAITTALGILQQKALQVDEGLTESKRSFDRLGVSVYDQNGKLKDAHTLLLDVSDAMKKLSNTTERTALARDLLGRSGTELIPTLTSNIRDLEAEARKLGITWTQTDANAAAELKDSMTRLHAQVEALKIQGFKELLPILNASAHAILSIKNTVDSFNTFMDTTILKMTGGALSFKQMKDEVYDFGLSINPVIGGFKNLYKIAKALGIIEEDVKKNTEGLINAPNFLPDLKAFQTDLATPPGGGNPELWLTEALKNVKPPAIEAQQEIKKLMTYIENFNGEFSRDYFVGPLIGGSTTDQVPGGQSFGPLQQQASAMQEEADQRKIERVQMILSMNEAENDLIRQRIDLLQIERDKAIEKQQQELQGWSQIAGATAGVLESTAGNNAEMLKFVKLLRIGEITANMAAAASQALNTPPPMNLVYFAQMIAMTGQLISQVKAIKSPPQPEIKIPSFAVEATVTRPVVAQVGDRPGGEYVLGIDRMDRQIAMLRNEIRQIGAGPRVIFDKMELIRGLAIEMPRVIQRENLH